MRPVLALDTATPTARVAALSRDGECLVVRERTATRHSANLLALCDEVLREAGTRVADLTAIVCGAGPGSFTGLRVGLAVAKGLALPTGVQLVLISSLEALAHDLAGRAPHAALLLPCIDAGKGQVYGRLYRGPGTPEAVGEVDWVLAPQDLARLAADAAATPALPPHDAGSAQVPALVAGGTGVDRYLDVFSQTLGQPAVLAALPGPSALSVGRLGLRRLEHGLIDDIETAVPRYGRPPDITRPKKPLLR